MLIKKMFRDMGKNKMQFISIFLMAFLGVFIFTGIGGEWAGVDRTRKEYYEETNLADGWIWGENLTDDDVNSIKAINGVTDAQKRFYAEVTGNDDNKPIIYLYGLDNNSICKPYVVNGKEFDSKSSTEIWLDTRFADAKGLKVGDSYTMSFQGTDMRRTIAGLIYSSEYQYYSNENDLWPDYNNIGFAYCGVNALPFKEYIIDVVKSDEYTVEDLADMFLTEEEKAENAKLISSVSKNFIIRMLEKEDASEFLSMLPYDQIIIKTSSDAKNIEDDITQVLGNKFAVYITRTENSGIQMLTAEMSQHKMMSGIFPLTFLLVAILAIITGMNRLISNQRTQIGTLEALGFSKLKITIHYIGYGFWMSLFGAAAGLIFGPLALPHLFYTSMASYFTLPEWKSGFDTSFIIVAAATVIICTAATFFTVLSIFKDTPAQALRPKAPKKIKRTASEKSTLWKRLGFNLRWNFRDFRRGKIKTFMGIVGTISCMALLVCAFSCFDSMKDMESWVYNEIQPCQTRFVLNENATFEQATEIANDIDGELIETQAIEVKANGSKVTATVTVCEGKGLYNITDASRNIIKPDDNTITLSKKIADKLGITAGDKVSWHVYTSSNWVTSEITIVDRVPMTQGMVMTSSTFKNAGYEFTPNYIDTLKEMNTYNNSSVDNILTKSDLQNFWDNYMETMNLMVVIIILFAVILAVVVLYNMGLLSFTEKQRELVTLKVIGFQSSKLRNLTVVQNLILSIVGVILGVPVGMSLTQSMIATAGDEFDMMASLSLTSFLIGAAITIGVSLLVSLLFSKKLRELDMVSSLKGIE